MENLKKQMQQVLEDNILRYWMDQMTDEENGGFYGRRDGSDIVDPKAEKGAILNARILWSFSAAYRVLKELKRPTSHLQRYYDAALRAKKYIVDHFIDPEYGGVYWSVDYQGNPLDTKKQSYAIGFMIYGMSEFARATANGSDEEQQEGRDALEIAKQLFRSLEDHAFDRENNGYLEAMTREWNRIEDMRLSDKDENGSKTMNTHLHILEPYTNLLRVWKDKELERQHRNLIDIFTDKILNPRTYHLDLFFDDEWQGKRNIQSFGHDIEASWLLHEAALVLGDEQVLRKVEPIVRRLADAADEGLRKNGAMIYEAFFESDGGKLEHANENYDWWVQCESIIGHVNLFEHFGDEDALDKAVRNWAFVQKYIIDWDNGEWHWGLLPDGSINKKDDKAGFWKCPYHNSRMCLELIEREY